MTVTACASLDKLNDHVRKITTESGGAFHLDIVQAKDMLPMLAAMLEGDQEAARLYGMCQQALDVIVAAPAGKRCLCATCDRELNAAGRFALVCVTPASDDPAGALAMGVCRRCGRTMPALKACAMKAARKIWPTAREFRITHAGGWA